MNRHELELGGGIEFELLIFPSSSATWSMTIVSILNDADHTLLRIVWKYQSTECEVGDRAGFIFRDEKIKLLLSTLKPQSEFQRYQLVNPMNPVTLIPPNVRYCSSFVLRSTSVRQKCQSRATRTNPDWLPYRNTVPSASKHLLQSALSIASGWTT